MNTKRGVVKKKDRPSTRLDIAMELSAINIMALRLYLSIQTPATIITSADPVCTVVYQIIED